MVAGDAPLVAYLSVQVCSVGAGDCVNHLTAHYRINLNPLSLEGREGLVEVVSPHLPAFDAAVFAFDDELHAVSARVSSVAGVREVGHGREVALRQRPVRLIAHILIPAVAVTGARDVGAQNQQTAEGQH